MASCKFTVIMPAFNSARFIEESIQSVVNQTYHDWELLIYDDGSTDDTASIVSAHALIDKRIKLFLGEGNQGAAVARNLLLDQANGELIAFLDSDDLWLPNKLHEHEVLMCNEEINISFSSYEVIDENGDKTGKTVDLNAPGKVGYQDMLKKTATMGCLTVVIRHAAFEEVSMPIIKQGQDYALWLKLLKETDSAWKIPKVMASYRIVRGSISRNKARKALRQWQIYRQIEKLSFLNACLYFAHYARRALSGL